MTTRFSCFLAGMVFLLPTGGSAGAQIRASERATVSQTIDGTVITIDYSRPRMRNRDKVFGGEVHWEEIWTPGANMATTLELSKDIQINGHPVPRGKYSVWMQVNRGDWVFMLDTNATRFHTVRPRKEKVMLQFAIKPEQKEKMDVLTWWFPQVRSDGAVLAMQWDKSYVPLNIKVTSSYPTTVSAEVARPLTGRYEMRWAPPPPDTTAPRDTTSHGESGGSGGYRSAPMTLEITYNRGSLWSTVNPPPFPGYDTMILQRMKDDWFIPGWWKEGELYDASDDMIMEFTMENGRATGFEMRGKDDELIATAVRVN
jgi:hypothetical protein